MKRQRLTVLLLFAVALALSAILFLALTEKPAHSKAARYTYSIVNMYPHDDNAFTEGLTYENDSLYESTGLNGGSTLRRVELETGEIQQLYTLPYEYFAEGITILDDKIIQLTWNNHKGFVYDKHSFDLLQEFNYAGDGWGITYDDTKLITSNGSSTLTFLNPETFEKTGQIEVHDTTPVANLNELEYVNGKVYANVWKEEKIVIINLQTGQVEGWIELSGIQNLEKQNGENVLNGIAYDAAGDRLFVTGKNWPHLFEIKITPLE